MSTFDTALSAVFDGREEGFSQHLRDLLRQLYDRGAHDFDLGSQVLAPAPKAAAKLPVKTSAVRVGNVIPTIAHLRAGHTFQNNYLKQQGQYREVVNRHKSQDGHVTHLTTRLVRATDRTVLTTEESFDQEKLLLYKPYRRIS